MASEPSNVRKRYQNRPNAATAYRALDPAVYMRVQERQRCLIRILDSNFGRDVAHLKVLEVGCGGGGNLLELISLGVAPAGLVGVELIEERADLARSRLPADTVVICGDAASSPLPPGPFDIVYQSTVFSSILDAEFRSRLAGRMWTCVKPGGGVLWYDFAFDNPRNPDVRGVTTDEIHSLFPLAASVSVHRVTLAPPIARFVTRMYPPLYNFFNSFSPLRTHRLCWIQKT